LHSAICQAVEVSKSFRRLTVQAVAEKSTMSAKTVEVMQAIHGTDVFANYGSLLPLDLQGWNSGHQAFRDIITKNTPPL
jgi:hypothetical protein